jgi:hypothetical protein
MGMMDEAIPDRYEHNPMLAVLENYVLAAIDKLDPDKAKLLNEMICRTFGGTDWRHIIRAQFDLPKETDDNIRQLWKQRQEQADAAQEDLSADQFSQEIVDELFADLGN